MSIASFSKPVPAGLRPTGCPVSVSPEPASRGRARRCFLRTLGVAAMLALTAGSTLRASADDWPQWRGPSRTGVSKEKGWTLAWPKEGPPSLWRTSVGMGYSSFAVADGRVFTLGNTTNTDTLFCFDAASGSSLWSHSYACPLDESTVEGGPLSTPTVDGSRVYTVSRRGHVFCLEADTGKVVWQKQLTDELSVTRPELGFASSPVVEGGALVLNAGGAGTVLDKATGKPLWNPAKGEAGYTMLSTPPLTVAYKLLARFSRPPPTVVKSSLVTFL